MERKYPQGMPEGHEQMHGERPGPRGLDREGGSAGRRMSDGGVLVAEIPRQSERLRSRPEWQLALRVASSKRLSKSDLMPKFLLYVCEQRLLGNIQDITEQRIGTQIFNRAADYNPGEDNIVRSYARMLRKRLDDYFEGEGRDEPMRIVIPRGGYVPVFEETKNVAEPYSSPDEQETVEPGNTAEANSAYLVEENVEASEAPVSARNEAQAVYWKPSWFSILAGLVLGIVCTTAVLIGMRRLEEERARSFSHAVWVQLFQPNRNTLIVPADSGVGILQNLTGHLAGLEDYANGSYLFDLKPVPGLSFENLNDLRQQRYTSVVCLNIAAMLTQLPEFSASHSEIRYARSITTEDLTSSNAILLGSTHTNPWVSLFEKNLNFRLEYMPEVDQSFVLNEHPTASEQARYVNGTAGTANLTYGAIDYLPSLDGKGHVLIIQGLNMAATQAAADSLFNSNEMRPILKQAALPNGSLKSFELLVETRSIGASAPGGQIIATRFYPQ
jgi:hypothetical protein